MKVVPRKVDCVGCCNILLDRRPFEYRINDKSGVGEFYLWNHLWVDKEGYPLGPIKMSFCPVCGKPLDRLRHVDPDTWEIQDCCTCVEYTAEEMDSHKISLESPVVLQDENYFVEEEHNGGISIA